VNTSDCGAEPSLIALLAEAREQRIFI